MPLLRIGYPEVNIHRGVFDFKMLNDGLPVRFTVVFSIVRDLDGREVMPFQITDQFNRNRDKIEAVAQQVFASRSPQTNQPVALQREHFFR